MGNLRAGVERGGRLARVGGASRTCRAPCAALRKRLDFVEMTHENAPEAPEEATPPVSGDDVVRRHLELETRLVEQQSQIAAQQEQALALIETIQADSKRQYKISLWSVALAALLVLVAFSSLKQQQATSAAQAGQISILTTDLKNSIDDTAGKLEAISTELELVGESTQRVAAQDAVAMSLPPTLHQITSSCGEVDLGQATIAFLNPRQCDMIEAHFVNRGINPVVVSAHLRIAGRYNLKCEPHEQARRIPPQKGSTFIFYVATCLTTFRSSFSGPAEGRIEFDYETL